MKIAGRDDLTYVLHEGDSILVGVTYEVTVGRDKNWVKYEASTKVHTGESTSDAETRVVGHVKESSMRTVDAIVEQIRSRS